MISFLPEFEGQIELREVPSDFAARLERRVEKGFLQPGFRKRANYMVESISDDEVMIKAADMLTAWNVGLNRINIRRDGRATLSYEVRFWTWTRFAVAQGLALGLIFLGGIAAFPGMRREISETPLGFTLITVLLVFFCLLWPWILTALHRRPAEKALQRILREAMI